MVKIAIWTAVLDDPGEASAAQALRRTLTPLFPEASITVVDVMARWGRKWQRTLLREGMAALQELFPGLWGALYHSDSRDQDVMTELRHVFAVDAIRKELAHQPCDLMITCHPAALWLAARLRWPVLESEPTRSFPVLAWIPAFHRHPSQAQPGISRYALTHPALLDEWRLLGLSNEKLFVADIPRSEPALSQTEARQQLHVADPPAPIVLVRADLLEQAEISLWLQQCRLSSQSVQWWLDYGEDHALATYLREEARRWDVPARMFGHQAAQRHVFYAAADVVWLRPQPWPVMEALASHTPPMLWQPKPGAESLDAAFLETHQLGVPVADLLAMDSALEKALQWSRSPVWSERLKPLLAASWQQQIQEILDQRDAILQQDAALLVSELELLQPHPEETQQTHRAELDSTATPAPIFEDIGQPAASRGSSAFSPPPPQKDDMLQRRLQESALEKELEQLKRRMKIDRSSLDLSKLEEE